MKKISVNLIAIWAIVLGASSAFTTKSKFVLDRWERFGVNQNTVTGSSSANDIYAQRRLDDFYHVSSSSMTNITFEINWHNTFSFKNVSCSSDATYICAAIVTYDHITPNTKALVDYDLGDYSIES